MDDSSPKRTLDDAVVPAATGESVESRESRESRESESAEVKIGWRAARTRAAILEASKKLFLERGYAGTRINNITDACGISRAGFYTYFRDKREVFNTLGEATYREMLDAVGVWGNLPHPCTKIDIEACIWRYFALMDEHGAFILSASARSGPGDEEAGAASNRMQMRVVWLLGVALRNRQRTPTDAPEVLGMTVQAMIDRSWFMSRVRRLPMDDADIVRMIATMLMGILEA